METKETGWGKWLVNYYLLFPKRWRGGRAGWKQQNEKEETELRCGGEDVKVKLKYFIHTFKIVWRICNFTYAPYIAQWLNDFSHPCKQFLIFVANKKPIDLQVCIVSWTIWTKAKKFFSPQSLLASRATACIVFASTLHLKIL